MGLISNIKRLFKQAPPLTGMLYGFFGSPIITKDDAVSFYQGWIYRCVDLRAKGIARVDWKLYQLNKKGEVEEILEHEILDLLYKFNQGTTKFDAVELSVTYFDIFGASPWVLEGGKNNGQPTAIYNARPEYMKTKRDNSGQITGYEYRIGKTVNHYEKDEVIVLKSFNPSSPDKGLGVIEAVRMTAQNEDYILQHNNNLLKNGANPSGVLEIDSKLTEKSFERLKKEWKDTHQGYENAGNPLLLEEGLKWKQISLPPKDLDFVASREMNRDEIAGIFGVPKPLLGFADANRASIWGLEYIFAKYTLEPLLTKIIEQLNEFLVPRYGDNLWLGFEDLAHGDEEAETNRRDKAINRWMTTNEVRAELGLPPVNGGDIIYMPMSNMPFMRDENPKKSFVELEGKAVNALKVDAKTAKTIKRRILNRNVRIKNLAEKSVDKSFKKLIESKKIILKLKEKKTVSDEQRENFYKRRMADETQLESLWEKNMTDFFEKQQERFIQAVEEGKKGLVEDYGISPYEELKSTIDIISPLIYETVKNGVMQASELIGEPAVFDMDFIKTWLDKVSQDTGESINETTIEAFEKTMKEGIAAGESLGDLKNRVEEVFNFAKAYRAQLIARTETARGVTEAHRKMYEHYGFDEMKWLLSPGACEICVEKAGQTWDVKSIEGEIPVHPQCKCDYTPI